MSNSEYFFNTCVKLWNDTILNYLETWRNIPSEDKKRMIDTMVEVVECLRMNRNDWKYSKDRYNGGEEEELSAQVDNHRVSLRMSKDEETETTDVMVCFSWYSGRRQAEHISFLFMIRYGDEGPSSVSFDWDIGRYHYMVKNDFPLSKIG